LTRIAEEDRRRRRPSARGSHGGAAGAGRSPAQSGARVARAVTPCLPRVQSLLDRGGHAGSSPIRASAGRGGPGEAGGGARKHNARVMFSDARAAAGRGPCCFRRRGEPPIWRSSPPGCTGRARRPRADKCALSDVPSGATCACRGLRGPPRPGRVGPVPGINPSPDPARCTHGKAWRRGPCGEEALEWWRAGPCARDVTPGLVRGWISWPCSACTARPWPRRSRRSSPAAVEGALRPPRRPSEPCRPGRPVSPGTPSRLPAAPH
jgi:hypothetical protein